MTGEDHGRGTRQLQRMIGELELSAGAQRASHAELQAAFADAVGPVADLIFAAEQRSGGEQAYVVRWLVTAIINDLTVTLHLLTHGYARQGYNALRTAHEACHLLELTATNASEAAAWVTSERGTEFAPARVRDRLGIRGDPVYSYMSGLAHPRFDASLLSSFGSGSMDGETQITMRVGPSPLDEIPDPWQLAGLLLSTTGLLLVKSAHLARLGAVSATRWERAATASGHAMGRMARIVGDELARFGLDAGEVVALYETTLQDILGADGDNSLDD